MHDGRLVEVKISHLANLRIPQVADVPGPSVCYIENRSAVGAGQHPDRMRSAMTVRAGNIRPWMSDSSIDFLNPVKYPPSMAFTLMTIGANLILLALLCG